MSHRSDSLREMAEFDAWYVLGVEQVRNQLASNDEHRAEPPRHLMVLAGSANVSLAQAMAAALGW
jgi:hypothetical protein